MANYLDTPIGIHRLIRAPYDDREIFESVEDLLEYCESGAYYTGQKVAVIFDTYVQNYTLFKINDRAYPLVELPPGYEFRNYNNGNNLLVYYSGPGTSWNSIESFTKFYSNEQWSIMDSIKCINPDDNAVYNVVKHTIDSNGTVTTSAVSITLVQSGMKFIGSSSNGTTYTLFPNLSQGNIIIEAYLTCNINYLKALGVK